MLASSHQPLLGANGKFAARIQRASLKGTRYQSAPQPECLMVVQMLWISPIPTSPQGFVGASPTRRWEFTDFREMGGLYNVHK